MTWKSPTITDPDRLDNDHAGRILASEFMTPLDLSAHALADAVAVPVARLNAVIAGESPVDAELDLRLGRYFRMSEGYFLRLQDQYEIIEAKRALNGALEWIEPRAA